MKKGEINKQDEIAGKIERMKSAVAEFNRIMFECKHEDLAMNFKPEVVQSGNINYYQLECQFYIKGGSVGHYFAEPPKPDGEPKIEIIK